MLILFDGRILVHNLTPEMNQLLKDAMGAEALPGITLKEQQSTPTDPQINTHASL